jgi:flagellar basal-body rod protein FlgB
MDILTNSNVPYLTKLLDVLAERHRVISNNIANVNTPGYRTKDISFDDILQKIDDASQETDREEAERKLGEVGLDHRDSGEGFDNKGLNDVDIEREMVKLATNSLLYKTYVAVLSMKLKQVNLAVKERV